MAGSNSLTCLARRRATASRNGSTGSTICFQKQAGSALSESAIPADATLVSAASIRARMYGCPPAESNPLCQEPPPPGSALLNTRVGAVIVNALLVLRLNLVPGHFRMRVQLQGDIAHQVLDEHRVVVGALRHRLLIFAFEQRIQFRTRRTLD